MFFCIQKCFFHCSSWTFSRYLIFFTQSSQKSIDRSNLISSPVSFKRIIFLQIGSTNIGIFGNILSVSMQFDIYEIRKWFQLLELSMWQLNGPQSVRTKQLHAIFQFFMCRISIGWPIFFISKAKLKSQRSTGNAINL